MVVEAEEIEELKEKLTNWISCDEYAKRFLRNNPSFNVQACEENRLKKIKIRSLKPEELLQEIKEHQLKIDLAPDIKRVRNSFIRPCKEG